MQNIIGYFGGSSLSLPKQPWHLISTLPTKCQEGMFSCSHSDKRATPQYIIGTKLAVIPTRAHPNWFAIINIGLASYMNYMLSPDFLGRINALLFPMLCISTGKTGEGRTITKKNLNSYYLKSSNYFPRLQSDCFEAPRKYMVPCSVTDNGNGDSETTVL